MSSIDLDNLTSEQKKLIHKLYEEGYISQNSYLQLKARVSSPPEPQNREIPSDEEFYGEDGKSTWHGDREESR